MKNRKITYITANYVIAGALCIAPTALFAGANQYNDINTATTAMVFKLHGTIPITIYNKQHQPKHIRLLNLTPNKEALRQYRKQLNSAYNQLKLASLTNQSMTTDSDALPSNDDLLPNKANYILDQEDFGSCATFASTWALDYILNLSPTSPNGISQTCNLQMGRLLNNINKYGGWNGSFPEDVLNQINQYGYMTVQQQDEGQCNMKTYPGKVGNLDPNYGEACDSDGQLNLQCQFPSMDLQDLLNTTSMKTKINEQYIPLIRDNLLPDGSRSMTPIGDGAMPNSSSYDPNPNNYHQALERLVKYAIVHNHPVIIGTAIPLTGMLYQSIPLIGYSKEKNPDTFGVVDWDKYPVDALAGHGIVITGYDDEAKGQYVDDQNNTVSPSQPGRFTIHNSWGRTGNNGTYYMTYYYFDLFATSLDIVVNPNNPDPAIKPLQSIAKYRHVFKNFIEAIKKNAISTASQASSNVPSDIDLSNNQATAVNLLSNIKTACEKDDDTNKYNSDPQQFCEDMEKTAATQAQRSVLGNISWQLQLPLAINTRTILMSELTQVTEGYSKLLKVITS